MVPLRNPRHKHRSKTSGDAWPERLENITTSDAQLARLHIKRVQNEAGGTRRGYRAAWKSARHSDVIAGRAFWRERRIHVAAFARRSTPGGRDRTGEVRKIENE